MLPVSTRINRAAGARLRRCHRHRHPATKPTRADDRTTKKRIDSALSLLLAEGRAVGVVVVGAIQDPRKDVIPQRDLFPVRVGPARRGGPDARSVVSALTHVSTCSTPLAAYEGQLGEALKRRIASNIT